MMISRHVRAIALLLILTNASGCATIVNGRYQQIPVRSEAPVEVTLRCDGLAAVSAPAPTSLAVKRRATPCEVIAGQTSVPLERRISRAFWANLLWSPILAGLAFTGSDDSDCQGAFFCTTRSEDAGIAAVLGLLFAGIGMGVDGATGALFEHGPKEIEIKLPPSAASSAPLR